MFDKVQRAVDFIHRNKGVDRMPSIAEKRLFRKKFEQHFMRALQRKKTGSPVVQCLLQELKKSKRLNLNWN